MSSIDLELEQRYYSKNDLTWLHQVHSQPFEKWRTCSQRWNSRVCKCDADEHVSESSWKDEMRRDKEWVDPSSVWQSWTWEQSGSNIHQWNSLFDPKSKETMRGSKSYWTRHCSSALAKLWL